VAKKQQAVANQNAGTLQDDVDHLFKLPLAEFTVARNELATRLKKEGRADDANLVKTLAKPSVTAWAVNQLYWKHRAAFDRLLSTSQRFRDAQNSGAAANIAEIRESLDARRIAISELSDLASEVLRDAGHNPTPDAIHRITTTLEALSAYATISDGPTPGRLTQDVDPPGFGSLAALIPPATTAKRNDRLSATDLSPKSRSAVAATQPGKTKSEELSKPRDAEEKRKARIAAGKTSLQEAKKLLTEARSRALQVESAYKKANAEAKAATAEATRAEKKWREAEEHFKKADAGSKEAIDRAQSIAAEAKQAAQSVEEAKRAIEKATKELESLMKESTAK